MNYEIVEIESIECLGEFNDEYVYDLEMEDKSHTFIANDILVHNTDSIFVGFKPAIDSCTWKNQIFNQEFLNNYDKDFIVINTDEITINNPNYKGFYTYEQVVNGEANLDVSTLLVHGLWVKDWTFNNAIKSFSGKKIYNWASELDFIHGLDHYRIEGYFKQCLEEHAESYGVENTQDFELERISESIINIAKKKYIQHVVFEDGIYYDRFKYIFPKGVELVRRSTPVFARDPERGIQKVLNYIFKNPESFNIADLIKLVKGIREEFELADIDDISMQSSVPKYDEYVENDTTSVEVGTGAYFTVKAAALYNYLLHNNEKYQTRYEFLKTGDKVKYYVCVNDKLPDLDLQYFAYLRDNHPLEFAPAVDYDTQFEKAMLSPINGIINALGMPEINKRLSVLNGLFDFNPEHHEQDINDAESFASGKLDDFSEDDLADLDDFDW